MTRIDKEDIKRAIDIVEDVSKLLQLRGQRYFENTKIQMSTGEMIFHSQDALYYEVLQLSTEFYQRVPLVAS